MENKQQNYSRSVNSKTCQSSEPNRKSSDLQLNKARRRDHSTAAKNEQTRSSKQTNNNNATKKQQNRFNADKRPRPRGGAGSGGGTGRNFNGSTCESEEFATTGTGLATDGSSAVKWHGHGPSDYELNSVYAAGSKKHNLNHLLNFHYAPREADYAMHGLSFFGRHSGSNTGGNNGNNKARIKQHKYNKEQFLQANFQFVIRAQAKPKFDASPDALIDWNLIEQINIQTTEEPQCPICLYPPIAAKITRCGHVYCWPCLLHYLSLADKSWRKCPICYEAIHAVDLKSCTIMQQKTVNVSDQITFRLMRRRRGSLFIEPYVCALPSVERYPQFSKNDMMQRFSKFLIANRSDVHEILERERRELSLSAAIDEGATCSEYIFIEQALSLLQERFEKLVPSQTNEQCEEIREEEEGGEQEEEKTENQLEELVAEHTAESDVTQAALVTIEDHNNEPDTESLDNVEHLTNAALTPTEPDELSVQGNLPELKGNSTKYHYFYQSEDGQNNYLHPLNIKMLQACYGSLDKAPLIITAKIVQREQFTMDDDHRRKLTCLSHLPLTCQLSFVEVDLQPPIVSSNILKIFKADIMYRRKERQRRQREECKREKHINELNDRQMGKLIASAANLNMNSPEEFPTCGFDDLPPLASSAGSSTGTPAAAQNVFSYSTITKVDDSWPATGPPRKNNAHFQELSSVAQMRRNVGNKKIQPVSATPAPALVESCDGVYSSMSTCLGDVLAEAFSQKHTSKGSQHKKDELQSTHHMQQGSGAGVNGSNKKSKKTKKMVPIFATGMNYNGNN